jgi:hypothetical protein
VDGGIIPVTSLLLEYGGAVALLLFFARGRGMIVAVLVVVLTTGCGRNVSLQRGKI